MAAGPVGRGAKLSTFMAGPESAFSRTGRNGCGPIASIVDDVGRRLSQKCAPECTDRHDRARPPGPKRNMSSMTPTATSRSEVEIMSLALVIAIILHVLVITQLHFDWINAGVSSPAPDLDVILVDWASESAPEEADFLAQANQIGGADNTEAERPTAPPALDSATSDGPAPQPQVESVPRPAAETRAERIIHQPAPQAELATADPDDPPVEVLPNARDLLRQTRQVAQTATDPTAMERVLPKSPRRKFITANTREHLYASYMRGWVAKVERIGNMNYPEQARRQNIDGSLVLSVDVLPDGSIEHIRLMRSSGYDLLDEAAIRIVRLAAPYAALPEEILAETDILTITRTWQFSARSGLN